MTACTAGCGADVHYKAKRCKACGAEQVRGVVVADPGQAGKVAAELIAPGAKVIVKTKPGAIDEPAEIKAAAPIDEPYICLEDFRLQIDNVNCPFVKGQVVTDFQTLELMKNLKLPIAPRSAVGGMACCPNCKTVFAIGKGAVPLSRSAA